MKKLCAVLALVLITSLANATNYYFSSSIGDDSRSSTDAQNPSTPWKTIQKLNAFFPNLKPGDFVYFKRGDVFNGTINVNKSGASGSPITIAAYGSGNKPVINGLTAISNWVNLGNGIWEGVSSSTNTVISSTTSTAPAPVAPTAPSAPTTTAPSSGSGLSYKYYEGTWDNLPDFGGLSPVATGTSSNVSLAPKRRDDNYAFLWEGKLNVPAAGTYYFETASDDGSKLYIGGYSNSATPVVDNNGLHAEQYKGGYYTFPSAGSYDIAIAFFERAGDDVMKVYWGNPSAGIANRTQIPDAAFGGSTTSTSTSSSTSSSSGLTYKYFEGSWSRLPDFGGLSPVATGTVSNVSIAPKKRDDNFAFMWQGKLNVPAAGTYYFETVSDDGSKLYIGGYSNFATPVVDNDGLHAEQYKGGYYTFPSAGAYDITVTFFESGGGESIRVYWGNPSAGIANRTQIPDAAFSSSGTSTTTAPSSGSGLSYKYYEGTWDNLPDFGGLSPVATGTSSNVSLAPKRRDDNYAFLWEGKLNVPAAGTYYFETASDDGSKLYIGGYSNSATPVVDNNGLHAEQYKGGYYTFPSAGSYDIAIAFFERAGDDVMKVYWGNPSAGIANRTQIPDAAFGGSTTSTSTSSSTSSSSGLTYKYFEGSWSRLPDFGGLSPVATGTVSNVSIAPKKRDDNFAFMWQGKLNVPAAGTYYFETVSDDGSKLYIGGYSNFATPVVDNDGLHAEQYKGGYYTFPSAGAYDITVTFFESGGGESIRVYWGNPSAGIANRTQIPDAAFSSSGSTLNINTNIVETAVSSQTLLATTQTTLDVTNASSTVESIPLGATVNMLIINGTPRAMGRYPNTGYLPVTSHSGGSQVTSSALPGYPNWTGGDIVMRKNRFVIDRHYINSHSGNTVNFNGSGTETEDKFGFFIQNHPQTLDQFGEWYFDPNSKKVKVYFGSENPNSYDVKATAADVVLNSFSSSYVTFDNISFQGSNRLGLDIRYAQSVELKNCDILYAGEDAIAIENMTNFKMENSKIEHTNNIALRTLGSTGTIIRSNTFNNTGAMAGMGKTSGVYTGMELYGNDILIEYNTITNTGYNAISFQGNNINIKNNFIDRFGFVKDDGGGIYSYHAADGAYGRKITGNIIMHGVGAGEGTNSPTWRPMYGIFMDDRANNVEITNNTVSESGAGIFVHNSSNLILDNNTFYNNVKQLYMTTDQVAAGAATRNITTTNNLLISKYSDQHVGDYETSFNDIPQFGSWDNNVYARPVDDNKTIFASYDNGQRIYAYLDLQSWKNLYGKDGSSRKSPIQLPSGSNPDNYIRFEYNASASARTISVDGTYLDARGNSYSGNVTLQPYTSLVLIKSGVVASATDTRVVSTVDTKGMTVFPNPATSQIEVSLKLPELANQKASLVIQSVTGATVKAIPITVTSGMVVKVDVSSLSKGVYFVNILNNGRFVFAKKFVKM